MELLRKIIEWIIRLMNPQSTDKVTENTNSKQFKIVYRSQNNLPDDVDGNRALHLYSGHHLFHFTGANNFYQVDSGGESIDILNFANPTVFFLFFKVNSSGKQLLFKSNSSVINKSGVFIGYGTNGENFDSTVYTLTTAEAFGIVSSWEIP